MTDTSIPNRQAEVDRAEEGILTEAEIAAAEAEMNAAQDKRDELADAERERRYDRRFREQDIGGVVDAAGNVTSDADPGM